MPIIGIITLIETLIQTGINVIPRVAELMATLRAKQNAGQEITHDDLADFAERFDEAALRLFAVDARKLRKIKDIGTLPDGDPGN